MNLKKRVPCESSLRIRLEEDAETLLPIIKQVVIQHLIRSKAAITPLYTGHIALDFDVTPDDNSNSKKEGVSLTYKGMDGYYPMNICFGQEGYCLGYELRKGSAQCQVGFIDTQERNYSALQEVIGKDPILSDSTADMTHVKIAKGCISKKRKSFSILS